MGIVDFSQMPTTDLKYFLHFLNDSASTETAKVPSFFRGLFKRQIRPSAPRK